MSVQDMQVTFMFARCRSGTTALLNAINATAEVAAFSEVLNGVLPHSYQRYMLDRVAAESSAKEEFLTKGPLFAFGDYAAHLAAQARAKKPTTRFLLLECKMENLRVLSYQWCHPANDFGQVEFLERAAALSSSSLFLQRRNVLERFCSNKLAHASGVFHSVQGRQDEALRKSPIQPFRLNVKSVIATFEQEVTYDRAFAGMLSRRFKDSESIEYERVFDAPTGGFTSAFQDVVARRFGGAQLAPPRFKKVAALGPTDIIINHAEVVEAIRASEILRHSLDP
jgi:hypothetical protein